MSWGLTTHLNYGYSTFKRVTIYSFPVSNIHQITKFQQTQ